MTTLDYIRDGSITSVTDILWHPNSKVKSDGDGSDSDHCGQVALGSRLTIDSTRAVGIIGRRYGRPTLLWHA